MTDNHERDLDPQQELDEFADTIAQLDTHIATLTRDGDPNGETDGLTHYRDRIAAAHQEAINRIEQGKAGG